MKRKNADGTTETKMETGTVRIDIVEGYSAFPLNGSVGFNGDNKKLDVFRVQQRLKPPAMGPAAKLPEIEEPAAVEKTKGEFVPGATTDKHGQQVAGVIGAQFDNGVGIDGINPYVEKHAADGHFLGISPPTFSTTIVIQAISEMLENWPDLRIVNTSFGFGWSKRSPGSPIDLNMEEDIRDEARDLGLQIRAIANRHPDVLFVATAGNDSAGTAPNGTGTPWAKDVHAVIASPFGYAALGPQTTIEKLKSIFITPPDNIIIVESTDPVMSAGGEYAKSDFSNVGGHVSAPGRMVLSTGLTDYNTASGTSFAAPMVTGLIGYLLTLDPSLSHSQIRQLISDSDFTRNTTTDSSQHPFGLSASANMVDAFSAVTGIDVLRGNNTIQERLVDVDDGSLLDGNARLDHDDENNNDDTDELYAIGIRHADGFRGDGAVNMKDFRVFRDALVQILERDGTLASSLVALDGPSSYFKKDLNSDGQASTPTENQYPRYDFNGSGSIEPGGRFATVSMTEAAPFKTSPDTPCPQLNFTAHCLRDIDVMADVWSGDSTELISVSGTDGSVIGMNSWGPTRNLLLDRDGDHVIDYLYSADFHFNIDADPDGTSNELKIEVKSKNGTAVPWDKSYTFPNGLDQDEKLILTVPLYASRNVEINVMRQGRTNVPINLPNIKYGSDHVIHLKTPKASITDVNRLEGSSGGGEGEVGNMFMFTVELDEAVDHEVRIDFETGDGSATIADNDYVANNGTLVFAPNEMQKTINVMVNNDSKPELDEQFFVTLKDSQQAILPENPATGGVINDDFPRLSIGDPSAVTEGDSGAVSVSFNVTLSPAAPFDVTFKYATGPSGTAIAGSDYTPVALTERTIPAGSTGTSISVDVLGDTNEENDETFSVTISDPINAVIDDGLALGTIIDDDEQPVVTPDTTGLWFGTWTQGNNFCHYAGFAAMNLRAFPQFTTVVTGDLTLDLSLDTSQSNNSSCTPTQDGFEDVIGTIRGSDIVINVQVPRGFVLSYQMVGDLNGPTNMTGNMTLLTIDGVRTTGVFDLNKISGVRAEHPAAVADPVAEAVSLESLDTIALAGMNLWSEADRNVSALLETNLIVTDLPGSLLAAAATDTIYVDRNAAGFGWFVDMTPDADEEFSWRRSDQVLRATDGSRASNGIDLLTVLAHELGHILGLDDLDADVYADDIMADTLPLGTRRLPWTEAVDRVFVEGL